ncbi:hypothetical protein YASMINEVIRUS_1543 [Yasminevirus sp. GU-2018]|uniref:Uncharacterized protein n=1 Tax=Yasminevirus sp. GU-2018 TaxID=2420051 RepID=A0A5K0UBA3_9VIRU|nr:hypothetical protein YASMINEVIRUS_1543 [Yasminevirus sp. GU-2018]
MGKYLFDQFSLLHFSVGVIAYFWGMDFKTWFVVHALFELLENTPQGVKFIDENLTLWPGGKKAPDFLINSVGDQISAVLGFLLAQVLDEYGKKYGWADVSMYALPKTSEKN